MVYNALRATQRPVKALQQVQNAPATDGYCILISLGNAPGQGVEPGSYTVMVDNPSFTYPNLTNT